MINSIAVHWLQLLIGILAAASMSGGNPADQGKDCFSRPSRCGYPDPTNTGVRQKTALEASGPTTVSDAGSTLDELDIKGPVTIDADDVTIENSRITADSGGEGSYAVILNQGADNFTIRNSEVRGGSRPGDGLESAVWNHYDNPGARAVGTYFHECADCWEGSGTFDDVYMIVNAAYPGSHDEDIYVCGGSVRVDHSTLINRHHQTATVFGDTSGCGGNHFTVTDSLLAGGGFLLYPQANSAASTGTMRVVGNRFARCRSKPVYDKLTGGTDCADGPDGHGLFPNGGYYGVAAYAYRGRGQTWRGNVWDDNSHPVCLSGSC